MVISVTRGILDGGPWAHIHLQLLAVLSISTSVGPRGTIFHVYATVSNLKIILVIQME